ncbi:MAG: hypothetical protein IRY95_10550 [Clostridia bacterium]|nr:hypothetical protein [Clostridia bacterium]
MPRISGLPTLSQREGDAVSIVRCDRCGRLVPRSACIDQLTPLGWRRFCRLCRHAAEHGPQAR